MSSPVAVVGLTYAGTDIQNANLAVFFEITRGLNEVPSVRGKDVTVPVRPGRIARSRVIDTLQIILEGQVTTDPTETDPDLSKASYRTNWTAVRSLFAPDRDVADLVATLEDGSSLTVPARPLNIVTRYEIPGWYWSGSIELEGLSDWEASGS